MENREQAETLLLETTRELVFEMHPHKRGSLRLDLDSALDQDLGLDSLSRMELLRRLEDRFDLQFPTNAPGRIECLGDLLKLLLEALPNRPLILEREPEERTDESPLEQPIQAKNLVEVLAHYAQICPDRRHLLYYPEDETPPQPLTFAQLWQASGEMAQGLADYGLEPGDRVALMLPTGLDYFHSFFAVLRMGCVPVPIYPPSRPSQLEEHLKRHAGILQNAETRMLITFPEAKMLSLFLKAKVEAMEYLITPAELRRPGVEAPKVDIRGRDIAFIQYTSGSTGNPKGVVLTHQNLLANIRAMGRAIQVTSQDRFLSWLPLYHDMGLIGAWLGSLYHGCDLAIMSPLRFLLRPESWLWAIHHHRATLSASPNFGYELCLSKIKEEKLKGLDLSSWRIAFNGAEPVSLATLEGFSRRFEPYGFNKNALTPVYGLAEVSLGLTFPPLKREVLIEHLDGRTLMNEGRAIPVNPKQEGAMPMIGAGRVLPDYELQIIDSQGNPLPERREGEIVFQGPSVTQAYFNNPDATGRLFIEGWCRSGDLGYLAGGELFITGRIKDVIIRAGRNLYPQQLEEEIGRLEGVRKGCVAIFGATDHATGTEKLVVLAETRLPEDKQILLRMAIEEKSMRLLELVPDQVILAPPHTVLKTSSGKIRRSAMRDLFERKLLGKGSQKSPKLWMQMTRLALAGGKAQAGAWARGMGGRLYGAYAWSMLAAMAASASTSLALLPSPSTRRKSMRSMSKALLALLGVKIEIAGEEKLKQAGPLILASNHASYIDVIILASILPDEVVVVAKEEFEKNPLTHYLFEKYGVEFVERFDPATAGGELEKLTHLLQKKKPLLIFPEGTFYRKSGLLPFHMGAFAAAAQTGAPILPLALQGTRWVLPDESWMPRKGKVRISIGDPITPQGSGWEEALTLRNQTRKFILAHCGEPDSA